MTMEIALGLLALSAPITAAIIKYAPSRTGNGNGDRSHYAKAVDFARVETQLSEVLRRLEKIERKLEEK